MDEGQTRVWCLLGKKAGDNTQVLALADALGLGYEEKLIIARPWELLVHIGHAATLAGVNRAASSPLLPPWPDLVISAGRRNEPVAQWIRRQSGGKTRLVHMGRPWAPLDRWDLLVTTPQYFLPRQPNVLHNSLPLHGGSHEFPAAGKASWRERFAHLPRPWIAVLVGGDSGRFVLTPAKGERLGQLANTLAGRCGGSVLYSDSPRTPLAAGDAFAAQLDVPQFGYRCSAGGDNPYRAFLALADAFVVTGESMSMLAEAADTGRPLFVFDVGDGDTPWWRLAHNYRYKPLSFHAAMRFGPQRMRRDIGRIQDALVESGRARWLTAESAGSARLPATEDATAKESGEAAAELRATAARVRQLLPAR